MSRVLLVDGTNLSRGPDYDPRFPEMESLRAEDLVQSLSRAAGRAEVEVFFDGPPRAGLEAAGVSVRFSRERSADELIEDRLRLLRRSGRSVTVATEDGALGREAEAEGARVVDGAGLRRLCGGR